MSELTELAGQAMPYVALYLTAVKTQVIDGAAEATIEQGKRLWGWIKGRFTSPSATGAIGELEEAPDSSDALETVQLKLAQLLDADPQLADELREILAAAGDSATVQTMNVEGKGHKSAQIIGSDNEVNIG